MIFPLLVFVRFILLHSLLINSHANPGIRFRVLRLLIVSVRWTKCK